MRVSLRKKNDIDFIMSRTNGILNGILNGTLLRLEKNIIIINYI